MKRNYIAGEWMDSAAAAEYINPSDTRDVLGLIARADATQAEAWINAGNKVVAGATCAGSSFAVVKRCLKVARYPLLVARNLRSQTGAFLARTPRPHAGNKPTHRPGARTGRV